MQRIFTSSLLLAAITIASLLVISPVSAQENEAVFGTIQAPPGVEQFNQQAGGGDNIGILIFLSNFTRLIAIGAGIFTMFNFILGGFQYVTSQGDTAVNTKVKDRLTYSVIGLVIIVGAYTISGLIGFIFFGDAAFILNPTLYGPGGVPTP